jgi:hypothetical protein
VRCSAWEEHAGLSLKLAREADFGLNSPEGDSGELKRLKALLGKNRKAPPTNPRWEAESLNQF